MKLGIFTATTLAIICALSLPATSAKPRHHRALHTTNPMVVGLGMGLKQMLDYTITHPQTSPK